MNAINESIISQKVTTKSKMKTNFNWTESHSRELSRIDRYLRFGTEMNTIHCEKNSSFNAFIKAEDESVRVPYKKSLTSVTNLWNSVKDFDINTQKMVANKIETVIVSIAEPFHENAITYVIISLFECQKSGDIQSPFRSLAISLIQKPFIRPINILVLCKAIGNKRINSSSRIRYTIGKYYSQEFNDKQLEEILVFGSKFGNFIFNYLLFKSIYSIDYGLNSGFQISSIDFGFYLCYKIYSIILFSGSISRLVSFRRHPIMSCQT